MNDFVEILKDSTWSLAAEKGSEEWWIIAQCIFGGAIPKNESTSYIINMSAVRLTPEDCRLLNLTQLAEHLGVSYDFVKDMRKMGFTLPIGGLTPLSHALDWLNENPNFREDARLLKLSRRGK